MAENDKTDATVEQAPKAPETILAHIGDKREQGSLRSDPIEGQKLTSSTVRRSRGHTPAGKLKSSRNSLRSGLFANAIILPGESSRQFNLLLENLAKSIRPDNELERVLTEKLASILWRQGRFLRAERAEIAKALYLLGVSPLTHLRGLGDESLTRIDELTISEDRLAPNDELRTLQEEAFLVPPLDALVRLTGYERHLGREFDRVLSQLERIRGLRKAEPDSSPSHVDVRATSDEQKASARTTSDDERT